MLVPGNYLLIVNRPSLREFIRYRVTSYGWHMTGQATNEEVAAMRLAVVEDDAAPRVPDVHCSFFRIEDPCL